MGGGGYNPMYFLLVCRWANWGLGAYKLVRGRLKNGGAYTACKR